MSRLFKSFSSQYSGPGLFALLWLGLTVGVAGCKPERAHRSEIRAHEQVKRVESPLTQRGLKSVGSGAQLSPQERMIVLARGEGIRITAGDLVDTLAELPLPLRIRYRERAKWEELLKDLVAFEILARASEDQGHGRDPLVLLAYKQDLVEKVLSETVAREITPGDIKDEEISRAYDEGPHLSQVPKMLHAFVLSTDTQEKVDAVHAKISEVAAEPDRVLARLKDLIPSYGASELEVGEGGDAGYVSEDGMGKNRGRSIQMVPEPFAKALFAAGEAEKIVGPMHTERGYMVGFVIDVRDGHRRTLDEMKLDIRNMLLEENREEAKKKKAKTLLAEAEARVDEEAFKKVFGQAASTGSQKKGDEKVEKPASSPGKYKLNIPGGVGPVRVKRVPNNRLQELGDQNAPKPGEISQ